ncbi:MAG TPA: acetyl/propionyl/methylcrotonyl-CoA carboxylase subunit alpha [Xanthobacteraceae bacterium]|nr:acetyl/propionyl/methylcrotonyl-CoA carboxylase subunit alpha [Xanthobacteraceae bacterium]
MFRSVLIANRGEIAVRVIRTARALGMRTIAVYSDADREALHVKSADEAHYIGPSPARASYLDVARIIEVARKARADCIHPGYGFLSERPELVEGCAAAGIVFVGPPPAAMRAMGSKSEAKALMAKAGVPVVPGYHGERQDPAFLKQKAYETGYPVLIKAAAGGGGKGMRKVDKQIDFEAALASAQREAESSFGDRRVLVEKAIESPRHIEIQIFADSHGNAVHLFERDCSAQRRHQKVLEEAPAPGMTAELREAMCRAAVTAAKAVGYQGAGTVEFIADGKKGLGLDGYYFLEMNTRLQVEHPVTEMVTGLDLVEWQFRVAAGERLPKKQDEIRLDGHAVEVRLYAEDPEKGFLPSTGKLFALRLPQGEGVRVDSGVEAGGEVTTFYDPMIAKVIAHASTREGALTRLARALDDTIIVGPRSNVAFLHALVSLPSMRAGKIDTGLIEREGAALGTAPRPTDFAAAARAVERLVAREQTRMSARARRRSDERHSPWDTADAFGFNGARETSYIVSVDGARATARVRFGVDGVHASIDGKNAVDCTVVEAGDGMAAWHRGRQTRVVPEEEIAIDLEHLDTGGLVSAPMHGKVLAIEVKKGERVKKGQRLCVIEAMKMEHALTAPLDGTVGEIAVKVGDQVAERAKLLVIAPEEAPAEPAGKT